MQFTHRASKSALKTAASFCLSPRPKAPTKMAAKAVVIFYSPSQTQEDGSAAQQTPVQLRKSGGNGGEDNM